MDGLTGDEIRRLRGGRSQTAFGHDVRVTMAEMLGAPLELVPTIPPSQVSRWEKRGVELSGKIQSLAYLSCLRRMQRCEAR